MDIKDNNWLLKEGIDQVNFYLNSRDVIIIERNRSIKLIIEILLIHFKTVSNLLILDLGCGDGILTEKLDNLFPDNHFHLLDGSPVMIKNAKKRLKGKRFQFQHTNFEKYITQQDNKQKYDFIFSSMAIHHLNFTDKMKLYEKIYEELKFNGMFLNYDVVKPDSSKSETIQFELWKNWMNEKLSVIEQGKEIGKHDGLPMIYKNKSENRPTSLISNLTLLKQTGFNDVDCFFKYSIFSLFGGIK